MINKYFNGELSKINNYNSKDKEILESINNLITKIGEDIENYHFKDAINRWMEIARIGNKYLTDEEPWKKFKENKERTEEIFYKLSITGEPFLPFTSNKLFKILNILKPKWDESLNNSVKLKILNTKIPFLFDKIEN